MPTKTKLEIDINLSHDEPISDVSDDMFNKVKEELKDLLKEEIDVVVYENAVENEQDNISSLKVGEFILHQFNLMKVDFKDRESMKPFIMEQHKEEIAEITKVEKKLDGEVEAILKEIMDKSTFEIKTDEYDEPNEVDRFDPTSAYGHYTETDGHTFYKGISINVDFMDSPFIKNLDKDVVLEILKDNIEAPKNLDMELEIDFQRIEQPKLKSKKGLKI